MHEDLPTVAHHHDEARSARALTDQEITTPKRVGGLPFRFMFDALAVAANRLDEGHDTIAALRDLGRAMANDPRKQPFNSDIPAAFTYFGQFIDHDITMGDPFRAPAKDPIAEERFDPLPAAQAQQFLTHARSKPVCLECVYEPPAAIEQDGSMLLGRVTPMSALVGPIRTGDMFHDLPRLPKIPNPRTVDEIKRDRAALIGDPRNDENLIISQLHVAFLRTHNALMARHEDARYQLRRRYQWAVLHDFLTRICDASVVAEIRAQGPKFMSVSDSSQLFMPIEFTGAAFRFGHSMIRDTYNYNSTFNDQMFLGSLKFLFSFTAYSGNISAHAGNGPNQTDTVPNNWIIEWPRFFDLSTHRGNPSRLIDTRLVLQLSELPDLQGHAIASHMGKLAARNLLRGYLLGLPTGQAIADFMGIERLDASALSAAAPDAVRATFERHGFHRRTPLWFYILAEAGDPSGPNGRHLGPIGSRIVAETLWNFVKHSHDSVLAAPPTDGELRSGEFTLRGIIKIGHDRGMRYQL